MMRDKLIEAMLWIMFIGIVVLAITATYESVHQTRTERTCLALGYREASWRWSGPAYCIAREQQSDIVVTLDSARRAPR